MPQTHRASAATTRRRLPPQPLYSSRRAACSRAPRRDPCAASHARNASRAIDAVATASCTAPRSRRSAAAPVCRAGSRRRGRAPPGWWSAPAAGARARRAPRSSSTSSLRPCTLITRQRRSPQAQGSACSIDAVAQFVTDRQLAHGWRGWWSQTFSPQSAGRRRAAGRIHHGSSSTQSAFRCSALCAHRCEAEGIGGAKPGCWRADV